MYIIQELNLIVNKHPKSQLLMMFMAEIYLQKLENIPKTLEFVRRLEALNLFLSIRNSLEFIYQRLEGTYLEKNFDSETQYGFSQYFKCYVITSHYKDVLLQETKKHLEFWTNIQKQEVRVKTLLDLSQEIDLLNLKAKKIFQENKNNFANNLTSSILLCAVYLNNVRDFHFEAIKLLNQFHKLHSKEHLKNEFDTVSGTSAVVLISLDRTKAGRIIEASGSIESLFNLRKTEIIGKRIEKLFPTMIAKQYQSYIQQYSKAPPHKLDLKEETYGKTTKDDIFQLEAQFKLYPYTNKEVIIFLLLKKVSNPLPVLIVNHDGIITDCSCSLRISLQNESVNVGTFKSVQNFILSFEIANIAINQVYNKEILSPKRESTLLTQDNFTKFDNQVTSSRPLLSIEGGVTTEYNKTIQTEIESPTIPNRVLHSRSIRILPTFKAKKICERYLKGRKVMIFTRDFENKGKLVGEMQITPYLVGDQVYKVIKLTNIKRETPSLIEEKGEEPPTQDDDSVQSIDSPGFQKSPKQIQNPNTPIKRFAILKQTLDAFIDNEKEENQDSKSETEENEMIHENTRNIKHLELNIDNANGFIVSHNQRESLIISTIRQLTTRKNPQSVLFCLRIVAIFLALSIIILSIVKLVTSRSSIKNIEGGIHIVYTATLRLQSSINSWLWGLILVTNTFPIEDISLYLRMELSKITNYNDDLQNYYSLSTDQSTIRKMFDKNIKMWSISEEGIPIFNAMDTFTASDYIVQQYLPLSLVTDVLQVYSFEDLPFTFNNTVNDYLLVSENIISETSAFLPIEASKGLRNLKIVLIIQLLLITMLASVFIAIAGILSKGYQKLCRALIKTREDAIIFRISQLQKVQSLLEDDIERKGFIEEAYGLFNENKNQEGEKEGTKMIRNKTYNMTSMNKHLAKLVVLSIFFLPIFIGFIVVTVIRSNDTFNELGSFAEQVSILSAACTQSSLIMSSAVYESLFWDIPSMLVRHQKPAHQLVETLEEFGNLNLKLVSTFLTKPKQGVDPLIEDVFQRDVCGYVEGDQALEECLNGTNYQTFGLLQLNTQYYTTLTTMMTILGTITDFPTAIEIFDSKKEEVIGVRSTLEIIYPFLISHVLNRFASQINDAEYHEIWFCLTACLFIIIYMIFVFAKPLKDLKRIDLGRRKILKVMPLQMIQDNKALKFYLTQDFKKEIESIQNIL